MLVDKMGYVKLAVDLGKDAALKLAPKLIHQAINQYNQMILNGEVERARSRIKVEFMKNRLVATAIYHKYKSEMQKDTREIYEEFINEGEST
jgi:hypothetical protein